MNAKLSILVPFQLNPHLFIQINQSIIRPFVAKENHPTALDGICGTKPARLSQLFIKAFQLELF